MEVASSLSKEKLIHSTSLALQLSNAHDGLGSNSVSIEDEEEAGKEASLLLDAAVTLCSIAAKKVTALFPLLIYAFTLQFQHLFHLEQANQISTEDYSMLPSLSMSSSGAAQQAEVPEHLAFPVASFSLSRDLLRCSVASCPALYLGRTLDLLSGAETVLAVYERIEGAAASNAVATASAAVVSSETHDIAGILTEGVFSRYRYVCSHDNCIFVARHF